MISEKIERKIIEIVSRLKSEVEDEEVLANMVLVELRGVLKPEVYNKNTKEIWDLVLKIA